MFSLEGTSAASLFSIYRGKNVLSFSPLLFSLRVILRRKKHSLQRVVVVLMLGYVCFVRVRVLCQYSPRKSRSSLSNVYVPPLAYNFASLVLVFRRLGFKTLNKLKCAKKKALTKKKRLWRRFTFIASSLANMSKRQQQQQSRRQKKTTATVAVEKNKNPCVVFVLLCCSLSILRMIFLLFASHLKVSFSRHNNCLFSLYSLLFADARLLLLLLLLPRSRRSFRVGFEKTGS